MVLGVGGSTFGAELERMAPMTGDAVPIGVAELHGRVAKGAAADARAGGWTRFISIPPATCATSPAWR